MKRNYCRRWTDTGFTSDWQWIDIGLAMYWYWIGNVLALHWQWIGLGDGLAYLLWAVNDGVLRHYGRSPIVLVPSAFPALSVWSGSWLARIGVALAAGYLIGRLFRTGWLRIGWTAWWWTLTLIDNWNWIGWLVYKLALCWHKIGTGLALNFMQDWDWIIVPRWD